VRMMFHLNDLMIKKTCGMTEWNKREKRSTSINTKHTDDDRHTTHRKIYTHRRT